MLNREKNTAPVIAISISAAVLGLSTPLLATADGIDKAFSEGDVSLNLRYRYENVDQDGKPEDADASTLKSRLTMKSGVVGGFMGLVEVNNVSYIGSDRFNNTENGKLTTPWLPIPTTQKSISYFSATPTMTKTKPPLAANALITAGSALLVVSPGAKTNKLLMPSAYNHLPSTS